VRLVGEFQLSPEVVDLNFVRGEFDGLSFVATDVTVNLVAVPPDRQAVVFQGLIRDRPQFSLLF
jgi:hypothetical protein